MGAKQPMKPSKHVTEARAAAQRAKLDTQAQSRRRATEAATTPKHRKGKQEHHDLLARRRARTTIEHAVEDYLADHEGGNHSLKTLQWHQTALGLLRRFLEEERGITLVGEVDDWNTPDKLPVGWAAVVSLVLGLVGVYLGASQQLFSGPLAKSLGGMDIGFELGIVFAGISYLILRRVELNSSRRGELSTNRG